MVNKKIISILLSLVLLFCFTALTFAKVAPSSDFKAKNKGVIKATKIENATTKEQLFEKKVAIAKQRGLTKEQVTNRANYRNALKSKIELTLPQTEEVPGGGDIYTILDGSFDTEEIFNTFDLIDLSTTGAGSDWLWVDYVAWGYELWYNSAIAPEPGGDFGGDVMAKDEAIQMIVGIPKTSDAGIPYRVASMTGSIYIGNPDPDDYMALEINEPPRFHIEDDMWVLQSNQFGDPTYGTAWIEDIITDPIAIPAGTTTLSFNHLINSEIEWDGGNVKVSTDGGATWTVIVPNEGYDIADLWAFKYHGAYLRGLTSNDINFGDPSAWDEPGYTSDSMDHLVPATFDLSAFAGQTILIKWQFESDGGYQEPNGGWWIDDVIVNNEGTAIFENYGTADNITASRMSIGYGSPWMVVALNDDEFAYWPGVASTSYEFSIDLTENVIGIPGDSVGFRFHVVYDDNNEGTGTDPNWGFEIWDWNLTVFTRLAEDIGITFADLDSSFTKGEPIYTGQTYDPQLVVSNFGLSDFKIYNTFVKIINDFGTSVYERYIYTYAPQQGDSLYSYPDFQPFNEDMEFYNFPNWTPQYEGDYTLIAYTELFDPDDDVTNDSMVVNFHVYQPEADFALVENFNTMDDTELYATWGSAGENGDDAWFIGDLFGNGDNELWCFHGDATVFADTIITPAMDFTGKSGILMTYEQHVYADSDPTFVGGVVVSVDSGKTWTTVKSMTRTSPSAARHGFMKLDLSALADGEANVLVGFFFNSTIAPPGAAGYQYFTVDDLMIYSGADVVPSAAPDTFGGISGDMQVTLTWNDITDAAYFTLYEALSDTLANANIVAETDGVSFVDDGLINDVAYYFWITASDFANNSSEFVGPIMVTPHDGAAPSRITDLEAHVMEDGTKIITWSAPVESDPEEGSYYDIRYAFEPITNDSWATATEIDDSLEVAAAGTEQSLMIDVTGPNNDVFFGIVTVDEVGNASLISNIAIADDIAPAKVIDLKAEAASENTVSLTWTAVGDDSLTGGAADHYEIRVDYEDFGGEFPNWDDAAVLTNVPAPAVPGTVETYVAVDYVYPASTKMSFQLIVYDNNNNISERSNVAVSDIWTSINKDEQKLPETFAIGQNYPNPFNPTTAISYQLPKATHVKLTVFSATGQQIRTLIDGTVPAGFHNIQWDAMDYSGHKVASGVYFYRIETPEFTGIRKMTLLK